MWFVLQRDLKVYLLDYFYFKTKKPSMVHIVCSGCKMVFSPSPWPRAAKPIRKQPVAYLQSGHWQHSTSCFTPQIHCSATELGDTDGAIKLLLELNIMYSRKSGISYNINFATIYCVLNCDFQCEVFST